MSKKTLRPAIAMIELIFAIVIIGITLMSAPMLISTAAKSGYAAIVQEAINATSSQVNMIMGYHWDENSADELFLDPILGVSAGSSDLNESFPSGRRIGTPAESSRCFVRSDNQRLDATPIGSGNSAKNDINDFAGYTDLFEIEFSLADYIEKTTIDINTAISYNNDNVSGGYNQSSITFNPFSNAATGSTTNIKSIIVTLTSSSAADELKKSIIMSAFSCNIGGYELEEKSF